MLAPAVLGDQAEETPEFQLTAEQVRFFEAFGYLKLPGLFADVVDQLDEGFNEVFAAKALLEYLGVVAEPPPWFETTFDIHFGARRITIPMITERNEKLGILDGHPRVRSIVESLIGPDYEPCGTEGNLYYCDTSWHHDQLGAPLKQLHIKLAIYLDPVDGESGAIRFIPGTHFPFSPFARQVRNDLMSPDSCREAYGIEPEEVPGVSVESQPGDLVLWTFRTLHATFHGGPGRRLLAMNFREPAAPDEG